MSDERIEAASGGGEGDGQPETPRYEPPRIVWREPYEPLSFGISCAHQQGTPGCNVGPFSS
jgi:hypothetical protein